MASRKVKLLGGALALLVSQAAMAVGLGEIKLHSALNEPLDAEIELLNIGDLSDLEMLVGLASRKDFERAGVAREFFLTGLQFTVDLSGKKPRVLVKTQKPVREPYLDFLVEMQWPTGRLLKEYTVLVDLPVYSEEKPQAKAVEKVSSKPTVDRQQPRTPSVRDSSAPAKVDLSGQYQVQSGDTLWGIAKRARPQGASIHQAMVTIHELNPRAFVGGDINMLKRGEVLRLPANHQITASHQEAVEEFSARQSSGALLDAVDAPAKQQSSAADEQQGRLKLSAALDEQAPEKSEDYSIAESERSRPGGDGVASRELLENELTIAQEELARKDRELGEYKERLAMLEQQLETKRLIELQSAEAGAMQAAGEAAEQQTQQSVAAKEPEVASEEQLAETVSEDKSAAKDAVANQSKADFWEQYKYPMMGGAGVLLLLLILLGLRRKKDDIGSSDDFVFDEEIEPVFAKPEAVVAQPETMDDKPEPEEVDLSEEDQLFAAEAFEVDEPEQEVEAEPAGDSETATDESSDDSLEMLPTLEEGSESESGQGRDDDLDFDIDLDLDDELVVSNDLDEKGSQDADGDEEVLEIDQLEVVADSSTGEGDGDFDLDIDGDEIATKLDLAKAYSDVGDKDGAREMLEEVVEEGNEEQQQEAKKLLESLSE